MGRVHGVSEEVCWGVGGGEGSCGKRQRGTGGVGGRVGKCGGGKERCVRSGEVWGGVWESVRVSGEVCWHVSRGMGKV